MKRILFSLTGLLIFSIVTFAQVTKSDYIVLADPSTEDTWIPWDGKYGDGGSSTIDLSLDNTIMIEFNLPQPTWYPFLGMRWFNPIDLSSYPNLMAKIKLPVATTGFGIELKANKEGTTDTLGLNGSATNNSMPRDPNFVGTGDWQYYEYSIGTWESGYPVSGVALDPTKVFGVGIFYGYNWGSTPPLTGTLEIKWIAVGKAGITAAGVDAAINSTGINSVKTAGLKVYPNPLTGNVLTVSSDSKLNNLAVYNSVGQKIYSKTGVNLEKAELQLDKLDKGVYLLRCDGVTSKFIVK